MVQEDNGKAETVEDEAEPHESCWQGFAALGGAAVMAATVTGAMDGSFVPC